MDFTYKIIRFNKQGDNTVIKRGLSLQEAQEHCNKTDIESKNWFDGYERE